ncbi:hypothetical protein ATANTOWER_008687 [Ataeniobius toweri]|uniref:Uncharacterized protein n=1 Tax=Ataeniobius toweri TaxID=208326 RepID=A0ABU7AAT8_9TELE|nr:hypothetical protein [Ataeniobius toweri]
MSCTFEEGKSPLFDTEIISPILIPWFLRGTNYNSEPPYEDGDTPTFQRVLTVVRRNLFSNICHNNPMYVKSSFSISLLSFPLDMILTTSLCSRAADCHSSYEGSHTC